MAPRHKSAPLQLEALEERIFFDANPLGGVIDPLALPDDQFVEPAPDQEIQSQPEEQGSEPVVEKPSTVETASAGDDEGGTEPVVGEQGTEEQVVVSESEDAGDSGIETNSVQVTNSIDNLGEQDATGQQGGDMLPPAEDGDLLAVQSDGVFATEAVDPMLGEQFTFTVTLDNPATETLYGPYIDLYFPSAGDDGGVNALGSGDGLIFDSASYLGSDLTSTVLTYDGTNDLLHPYAVDSSGNPLVISTSPNGDPLQRNDAVVILEMPFGSFTPDQPSAEVVVKAHISSESLVDSAGGDTYDYSVQVTNGFRYGTTAINDYTTDPSVSYDQTSTITYSGTERLTHTTQVFRPEVVRFNKDYIGPEQETATGPNFVRTYEIDIDVADGQTVTGLQVFEHLPDTIFYKGNSTITGGTVWTSPDGSIIDGVGVAAEADGIYAGGELVIDVGTIVGGPGVDRTVSFQYYVPYQESSGAVIISRDDGDDNDNQPIINDAEIKFDWDPTDPDDAPVTDIVVDTEVNADGTFAADPDNDEEFTAKALAIQKGVLIETNTGVTGYNPGDIVKYTLNFQVSDYFNVGNIVITDVLPDGLDIWTDSGYEPTYSISDMGGTYDGDWTVGTNLTEFILPNHDTRLVFDVFDVAGYDAGTNGVLRGTLSDQTDNSGDLGVGVKAVGTITYYAKILEEYTSEDTGQAVDSFVDQGDLFNNSVTIDGTIYQGDPNNPVTLVSGDTESDGSGAHFAIATGSGKKEVYAINGAAAVKDSSGNYHMQPGDEVTYRLTYTLPTSDFESFELVDYLPLPVLDVDNQGAFTFDGVETSDFASSPDFGHVRRLVSDTFYDYSSVNPTLSTDSGANSITFSYGSYHSTSTEQQTIDLVFTVIVSDDPFADGLYLTNQVRAIEDGTLGDPSYLDQIVQIVLDEPELEITKGVVATSSTTATFTDDVGPVTFNAPGSADARWTGSITESNIAETGGTPIDADLSGIDAGDLVTFAVVVQNVGHGNAFNIKLQDELPTGFAVPGGGLNLRITDGAGNLYDSGTDYDIGSDGFLGDGVDNGITFTDDIDGFLIANSDADNSQTDNIIIITYDLVATDTVGPLQSMVNTASITNYSGTETGADHTAVDLTDTATVTADTPGFVKEVVGTNKLATDQAGGFESGDTDVVVGERVLYRITVTVPEGTTDNFQITDTLDSGMAFVGFAGLTQTGGVGFGVADPAASAVIGVGGQTLTLDFGQVTNTSSNNDGDDEYITLEYWAVALNTAGNQQGDVLGNTARLDWQDGNGTAHSVQDTDTSVTIQEPALQVVKEAGDADASTWSTNYEVDQADAIDYRIIIRHTATSPEDAYDVTFSDVLPADIDWSSMANWNAATDPTLEVSGTAPSSYSYNTSTRELTATWDSLAIGSTTTFIIKGGKLTSATGGQVINNTGAVTWESLPEDGNIPISTYNTNSVERTGDGGVNDYATQESAAVSVAHGTIDKRNPIPATYTIGDTVTYDIVVTLPEGTINNLVVTDALPDGLQYQSLQVITDASASGGVLAGSFNGTLGNAAPTPNPALPGDGTDVSWNLGNVSVDDDNVITNNSFLLRVTALVAKGNSNTSSHYNQHGDTLSNAASMTYDGLGSPVVDPDNPQIAVVEPRIVTDKSVSGTPSPGETLTYTVRFTNTNVATAYEVSATDDLPSGVKLLLGSWSAKDQSGASVGVAIDDDGSGNLTISGLVDDWDIAQNDWIEVQYQVVVMSAGFTAGSHNNSVDANWSSKDGNDANERVYNDPVTQITSVDGNQDTDSASFTPDLTGSIGDLVYYDGDDSGDLSAGDAGIKGVNVTITADVDNDGAPEYSKTVTTDDNGNYLFSNLPAFSNYVITVDQSTLPEDVHQTYDPGGSSSHDSSHTLSLSAGENIVTVDFGYTGDNDGRIGDYVWFDVDGEGDQDESGFGVKGVDIILHGDLDGDGNFEYTATATTDDNGHYEFTNLPLESYWVELDTASLPAGFSQITHDRDNNLDGKVENIGILADPWNISDPIKGDLDFGITGTGTIGNYIWNNSNGDDVQDGSESGLGGVTVRLTGDFDNDGQVETLTTTTVSDGSYEFSRLPAGQFTVTVEETTLPDSFVITSDPDGTEDSSSTINLPANGNRDNVDFGYTETSSIGDTVYYDTNNNGLQDAGEAGLTGVKVTLTGDVDLDGVDETVNVTTDSNGQYLFDNILFGDYTVEVDTSSLPGGMKPTYDVDGVATADTSTVTVGLGEDRRDVDFGYTGTGSIGDQLWIDENRNGVVDPGEPGIPGVKLTLEVDLDGNGTVDYTTTTVTDGAGNYLFTNLPAGSHTLTIDPSTIPSELVENYEFDGLLDGTMVVKLGAGQDFRDADFGYYKPEPPEKTGTTNLSTITSPTESLPDLTLDSATLRNVGNRSSALDDFFEDWRLDDNVFQQQMLQVSPVYSGHAEPGTTLTITISDSQGDAVGSQTVMADSGGNWISNFGGTMLMELPHQIQIGQTMSSYNASTPGGFNMRTYYSSAIGAAPYSSHVESVGSVFATLPDTVLKSISQHYTQPAVLRWNDFYGYEFFTPSTNPGQNIL